MFTNMNITISETDDEELYNKYYTLTPEDRVKLARHKMRPNTHDYISALFTDFFPLRGDRHEREDESILGGIAFFKGRAVTVIGHRKGRNLEENIRYNFGMPGPEGYRKVERLVKQADKFKRPVITFIDTPGAFPGIDAEAKGQGEAIARCISTFSSLRVPVIAVVTGEGGSGGALALGMANSVIMLENAIYSVLSPEGFASILWKDASRSGEASNMMKLTAADLMEFGIIDHVLPEPKGGAHRSPEKVYIQLSHLIEQELIRLDNMSGAALASARYKKFRNMGEWQHI